MKKSQMLLAAKSCVLMLAGLFALSSCEHIQLDDVEEQVQTKDCTALQIITRSTGNEALCYPLHFYAFTEEGTLQTQLEVTDEEQTVKMSLPKGNAYRIVVVSADENIFELPAKPSLTSTIKLRSTNGYADDQALMMGFADINPTTSNTARCHIQLQHQMASLYLKLQHTPASVQSVVVSVASSYGGVTLNGVGLSNQVIARIPLTCTTQGDVDGECMWESGEVYVFPTVAPQTTFTIAYTTASGEQYSSVTYQSTLRAGTPYVLVGEYSDDNVHLSADVVSDTWNNAVNLNFEFGDGINSTLSEDGILTGGDHFDPSEVITVMVDEIPEAYTLWKGHLVACVRGVDNESLQDDASEALLLLMSLDDWSDMTSSLNTTLPTEAFDLASSYQEGDFLGWRIPTAAEGSLLYAAYNDTPSGSSPLEKLISKTKNAMSVALTDEKGDKVRYLCDNAEKTFSFGFDTILAAGRTVKNYHMRLVKTVLVKLR